MRVSACSQNRLRVKYTTDTDNLTLYLDKMNEIKEGESVCAETASQILA